MKMLLIYKAQNDIIVIIAKGNSPNQNTKGSRNGWKVEGMKELKVKEWVINKAQETATRYNVFIDYARRTDDIESKPLVEDGCVFVKVEEILKETEKAIQIRLSSGEVVGSYKGWTLWIPKSQIA